MQARVFLVITALFALSYAFAAPAVRTVRQGDTLFRLALACKCQVADLKRWNNLKSDTLRVGQRLRFGPATSSTRATAPKYDVRLSLQTVLGEPVAVVRVNVGNPRVRVSALLPRSGLGRGGALLTTLAKRSGAKAAINGGFFHTRTYAPVGDVVVAGRHLSRGRVSTALAITWDHRVRVVTQRPTARRGAWRGFETVIGNGPYIVQGGRVRVRPFAEGYRDTSMMRPASRSAVGVLNNREIILVSTKQQLSLEKLALVMRALGAKDALAMDGGSSTSMTWGGKALIRPGRAISYGIGVFVKR